MMIHCSLISARLFIVVIILLQFSQSLYSIIEVFVLSIETQEFEVSNQVVPRTMHVNHSFETSYHAYIDDPLLCETTTFGELFLV